MIQERFAKQHVAGTVDKVPTDAAEAGVHIIILRPQFIEYFTIVLDNHYSEELEPDECRAWFKERGANMDAIEKALDHAWNFARVEVYIKNYREPLVNRLAHAPRI